MTRRLLWIFLGALLFGVIAIGGAFGWGYAQFTQPGPASLDRTVLLPKGSSLNNIAERLAVAGVIDRPLVFRIGVRVGGWGRGLKAGEYRFPAQISMRGAVEILRKGDTVVRRVTIPEGLSSRQVVALLAQTQGLRGDVAEVPAEGTLLPETYHYSYGDERAVLLARMTEAMNTTLATLWPLRDQGLPFANPDEARILAAMVEKETSLPDERPRGAGGFINRLRRGMRLQSDPTVVYGLTEGGSPLGRALSRADLDLRTPYNTYRIAGLPPGPIANPGRAAIGAVLHPLVSNELYFVADGTGGHAFAATFAEHRRNVRRWRRAKAAGKR
ncbi:MAG: endolytic transglycosylase MltG [Alphaproteobacteria bacterium]|nr:endolytic transglycosylase MltG [Alphaproteobacteria bacterium]